MYLLFSFFYIKLYMKDIILCNDYAGVVLKCLKLQCKDALNVSYIIKLNNVHKHFRCKMLIYLKWTVFCNVNGEAID